MGVSQYNERSPFLSVFPINKYFKVCKKNTFICGILVSRVIFFFYRLSVVSNNIEGEGLVALSQSLKANCTFSNIYIWGNKFDEATCVVSFFPLTDDFL